MSEGEKQINDIQDLLSEVDEEDAQGKDNQQISTTQAKNKVTNEYPDIFENRRARDTQAYMLVYLREDMREKILQQPNLNEVPEKLKEMFDKENVVVDTMKKELDVHNECGIVYLITQEIIQDQFFD